MNFRRRSPTELAERAAAELARREDPYTVTQASRIYFLPNLMTAGNLFCGFMAIVQCMQARLSETALTGEYLGHTPADYYRYAVWCIFGAAAFDGLDGRLARVGGRESLFGAEFDSIADVVSFGVAPTLMVMYLIIAPTQGYEMFRNIGWAIGFVYLLCGAMRLARFNVITNPLLRPGKKETNKDFVGLPVPAAAGTVAALVLFLLKLADSDKSLKAWALALPFLMLLIGLLMMSTVRYPSGKAIDLQTKMKFRSFAGALVLVGLVLFFKEYALLAVCLGYIFFGLIRHWRRPSHSPAPAPVQHPSDNL
jgi:CDP-diacylglycerol--serine O-phosphatidyltransferase